VNILGQHQEEVSRLFAKRAAPEIGSLRGVNFRFGESGAPVLEDSLAYIECRVEDVLSGGDHSIFIGAVLDAAMVHEGKPLIFYRGAYHALSEI
jgi:3-hydroxy-9,10-secoandrosta-1,3,5(10)-triene-9,17-dione monooxygenase reductase component